MKIQTSKPTLILNYILKFKEQNKVQLLIADKNNN